MTHCISRRYIAIVADMYSVTDHYSAAPKQEIIISHPPLICTMSMRVWIGKVYMSSS